MSDNPSAFPSNGPLLDRGMTLRDWFAGQVVQGFVARGLPKDLARDSAEIVPRLSYAIADAMLAERAKGGQQ